MLSWRMLGATACLLVATLGATAQVYEEQPPGHMSLMYQDLNLKEPVADENDEVIRSLLLYKMLTSLKNQDVSLNALAGPKWVSSGADPMPLENVNLSLLKRSIVKRAAKIGGITPTTKDVTEQTPQKLKITPGILRPLKICYLKICPPT